MNNHTVMQQKVTRQQGFNLGQFGESIQRGYLRVIAFLPSSLELNQKAQISLHMRQLEQCIIVVSNLNLERTNRLQGNRIQFAAL